MNIQGLLIDGKSGKPIPGRFTVLENGNPILGPINVTSDGAFWITGMASNEQTVLKLESSGYDTQAWTALQLTEGENIFYLMPAGFGLLPVAGLAAAALYFGSKKKKRVGEINVKNVALIGGGVIAFSLLSQLLIKLGIWDSKDTKDLNTDSTNPDSFWNPNFWRNSSSYSYAITTTTAAAYAKEIYDAFGAFNDCEECAKAVFRRMRTKANVSFLADVFYQKYGQDLLSFLRGGWWPQDRLSDADVNEINQYVKNLPSY